ncbi:MAG: acylneuraminate cytidylyltransferase [Anaerolineales bacterium]|nr:acylneuraminate cytidylyltransferase [Anaerolineales bacterium]
MTNEQQVLALIPARGGSKGIPRKNIRVLAGKPLLAWTIEAALAAETVNRVVVSTDDLEIAQVARAHGAEVLMRPPELATDTASSESALLHALETLQAQEGYAPDVLAFLQCTAPLTTPADVDGTVSLVLADGYDTAVTMIPYHYFLWRDAGAGQMAGINHEATRRLRRQEREPEFQEVGAVYAMRVPGFLAQRFRFFGRIGKHLVPPLRAFEIDDPADWAVAEALMHGTGRSRAAIRPSADRLRAIRAVVTDFDGVLTDNRVQVTQDGTEAVVCSRGDGWGIDLLKQAGYRVACISTEANPVVAARCRKLDIPYWQAQRDKRTALENYLAAQGIPAAACLYVGNDTNDLGCLALAGVAAAPRDAAPEALAAAHWVTEARGGEGVLREIARHLLQAGEAAA